MNLNATNERAWEAQVGTFGVFDTREYTPEAADCNV